MRRRGLRAVYHDIMTTRSTRTESTISGMRCKRPRDLSADLGGIKCDAPQISVSVDQELSIWRSIASNFCAYCIAAHGRGCE